MAQILLVTLGDRGPARKKALETAGHTVTLAEAMSRAMDVLASHSPDLLITEIRLGAFNGLYLVIRYGETHSSMRAILIDKSYDRVLAGDAQRYGAVYVSEPLDEAELLEHVSRSLAKTGKRRWPRKQLASELVAEVQDQTARVLDLSYGGLRLEIPRTAEVPTHFPVVFPGHDLAIRARTVWTSRAPSGSMWCGAERFEADATTETEWCHLVDSVGG